MSNAMSVADDPNNALGANGFAGQFIKASNIQAAASTIYIGEVIDKLLPAGTVIAGYQGGFTTAATGAGGAALWPSIVATNFHSDGRNNYLFADGHVQALKLAQTYAPTGTAAKPFGMWVITK